MRCRDAGHLRWDDWVACPGTYKGTICFAIDTPLFVITASQVYLINAEGSIESDRIMKFKSYIHMIMSS